MKRAATVLALVAFVLCVPVSSAFARNVSDEEFGVLAQRARVDPAALADLRTVDSVDGKRVDVVRALDGADPAALDARLASLGDRKGRPRVDPAAARSAAARIVANRKYHEARAPRPFGDAMKRLGDWLDRVTRPIFRHLPGGRAMFWLIIAVVVLMLVVFVTARLARRKERVSTDHVERMRRERDDEDPKRLERKAEEAERRGELAEAIRLRFRAGLLRLDAAGAIEYSPHLTAGQTKQALRLETFDRVATSFEEVIYGDRMPTPDDASMSKDGWGRVMTEVAK